MSTVIMSACWPLQMPPTPKAVLVSLADNANDHGDCWPSIPTICQRTCFSERAVQAAIHWLEAHGAVTANRANGRHTRYQVTPAGYAPPQDMHPRISSTTAADAPAQLTTKPPQLPRQPPQEVPSNRKEPPRKATVKDSPDFSSWPSIPSDQVLADWLSLRKRKKAENSSTAMSRIGAELRKATLSGFTVDDCLAEAVARNWTGIKADWMQPDKPNGADHVRPRLSAAERVLANNRAAEERERLAEQER